MATAVSAGGAQERLLESARPHRPRRLARREQAVELVAAASLLAVAGAMAAAAGPTRPLEPGTLVLGVALYAAATRVRLYVGAGSALPTQIVFVPLLFALPVASVPLVVAAGLAASAAFEVLRGRAHPERIVTATADGWYAVAPAAVLGLAGGPSPELRHVGVLAAAFAAQSASDVVSSTAREWLGRGIRPGLQLRVMGSVYAVDALLAPLGLLVAVAARDHGAELLFAVPLLVLLSIFARDRRMRIDRAIARLDELERERARLQGTIRRVGEAFASTLDDRALVALVLDTTMDALEASSGRASTGGATVARQDDDPDPDAARALGLAARAAATEAAPAPVACGSAWALARSLRGGTIAVARHGRAFSARDEELIGYLAAQCAVSLENARLHGELMRQATVDELTGLSNHRRLQQALDEELARSRRFPGPVSLLLLDIDDFKKVNDTYGHLQGDEVLRAVAGAVRDHVRGSDEAARYGGEELAVLLRGTRVAGAHAAAEAIRRAIEALRVPLDDGGELRVTASIGVAELRGADGDKNRLIAAADHALYDAKRAGKNRTVAAQPATSPA